MNNIQFDGEIATCERVKGKVSDGNGMQYCDGYISCANIAQQLCQHNSTYTFSQVPGNVSHNGMYKHTYFQMECVYVFRTGCTDNFVPACAPA